MIVTGHVLFIIYVAKRLLSMLDQLPIAEHQARIGFLWGNKFKLVSHTEALQNLSTNFYGSSSQKHVSQNASVCVLL